ncbi:hypothetical protein ACFLYE_01210 [Chloroflexota bacterium]
MKASVSIMLGYVCPKCKRKLKITLQEALSGLVACSACVARDRGAVLVGVTRILDDADRVVTSLKVSFGNN